MLVDSRLLDTWLFHFLSGDRLTRADFLNKIGLPERPGLRIFVRGYLVPESDVLIFAQGDTVTLLPPGTPLGHMVDLEALLGCIRSCDLALPSFPGPAPAAFGVLTDEGFKVLAVDLTRVHSGAVFKQTIGAALQYDLTATLFRPASPKIANFAHQGHCCQAVFLW